MIIDITKLKSSIVDEIELDEKIELDLSSTEIIELKDARIKGSISRDDISYYINAVISGVMVLPCSITLKPVDVPFSTEISGNIEEMLEETEENVKKSEFTIDILPIIWENILMEIPMKVVSDDISDAKLEGDGWKVIEDDEPSLNPELQKLKDLFK